METKINWDFLGIFTSVACAIHCAVLPLLVTSLPVLGVNLVHNAFFEWGMIGLAFVVGSYALFYGYIRQHHSLSPVAIFSTGFVFLVLKQFFHSQENWFLLVAVPLIVGAHFYNYRLAHRRKSHSQPQNA